MDTDWIAIANLVLIQPKGLELGELAEGVLFDARNLSAGQVQHLQLLQAGKEGRSQAAQLVAGQAEAVQVGQPGRRPVEAAYSILAEVEGAQGGGGGQLGGEAGEQVGAQVQVLGEWVGSCIYSNMMLCMNKNLS